MVITIALDSGGVDAAGPWIKLAKPTHPSLIDRDHRSADLYDMVNVPSAVWIDERGRVVRPTEPSGTHDGFRAMDRKTFAMPAEVMAEYARRRRVYTDAIRDWVSRGDSSPFALSESDARARAGRPTREHALAAASFRLGQHLATQGRAAEAEPFLEQAVRLRPESWSFFRQKLWLRDPNAPGGPEFWSRVDALGERRYYDPVRMPGLEP